MNINKLLESPRPSLYRENFISLNGKWDFVFDDENEGENKNFNNGFKSDLEIIVPFAFECKASGINIQTRHDHVWYQRHIDINKKEEEKYLLHLEGIDYVGKIFLNGKLVGTTKGAYFRHTLDLTNFVNDGDNLLVIKCDDDYSNEKPRGKQRSRDESYECYYVDTTGIYKDVWLEVVPNSFISHVRIDPILDDKKLILEVETIDSIGKTFEVKILKDNFVIDTKKVSINSDVLKVDVLLAEIIPWSIENPYLYDLELTITDGEKVIDKVASYCGFRSIKAKDAKIYLNNKELYQKLVLDQGYWKETNLSCPNVKALEEDIKMMQSFGFNGCRKHQKIEDERFLLLADILGFITWVEIPSSYEFSETMMENYMYELPYILKQNYNHPSVITWTLFNESWGIKEILTDKKIQDFTVEAYNFTKKYDPNRFAITNDGWEHTTSDIITFHHYEQDAEKFFSYYESKDISLTTIWKAHWKGAFANGYSYKGQPIIFSEFGGTAFNKNTDGTNWGYGAGVDNDEQYIERVCSLINALHKLDYLAGYCYTQVSDVEQEVNGLLNHEHKMKVNPSKIKAIQDLK